MAATRDTDVLDKVRNTCRAVADSAQDVKIVTAGVDRFLTELDAEKFNKRSAPTGFPLRFENLRQELNFWAILDLLNIGSGYRSALHKRAGRGAYETIQYGLVGMHIAGVRLDSEFMTKFTVHDVETFFHFPVSQEVPVEGNSAIRTLAPTELAPFAQALAHLMNDTGARLRNLGKDSLADFILSTLSTSDQTAPTFVNALVQAFPGFRDIHTYQGQEVYILKKAQLLAADLYRRFAEPDDPSKVSQEQADFASRIQFKDLDKLTIFSDNVVPAVLRKLGVLELSEGLAAHIDSGKPLPAGPQEVELRACAVAACADIVARAKTKGGTQFNEMQLDYYLWTIGKDEPFRPCERHYTHSLYY